MFLRLNTFPEVKHLEINSKINLINPNFASETISHHQVQLEREIPYYPIISINSRTVSVTCIDKSHNPSIFGTTFFVDFLTGDLPQLTSLVGIKQRLFLTRCGVLERKERQLATHPEFVGSGGGYAPLLLANGGGGVARPLPVSGRCSVTSSGWRRSSGGRSILPTGRGPILPGSPILTPLRSPVVRGGCRWVLATRGSSVLGRSGARWVTSRSRD